MSKRKISHWGETTTEAFGANGAKGLEGENFFVESYKKLGYKVSHFHKEKKEQLAGIDVVLESDDGTTYSIDVKANLRNDETFVVEHRDNGWLYNPKHTSYYIAHVNVAKKLIATYTRQAMQKYLKEATNHEVHGSGKFLYITREKAPSFVKWKHLE